MRTTQMTLEMLARRSLRWMTIPAIMTLLMTGQSQRSFAQQPGLKTFSSAAEASQALFRALEDNDEQALEAILGTDGEITGTSDNVEAKLEREHFREKYKEMHRLVREPDGTTVLYIGAENWPFPIALKSKEGKWSFDTETGKQEMLFRTIGENEGAAIEVCQALVAARASRGTDGQTDDPIREFAESVVSRAKTGPGESANATQQQEPFFGYHFRAPGAAAKTSPSADGTAAGASKAARVAYVAHPAKYLSSGVMTFIVTTDGVVHQKDLGPETPKLALDIQDRKPRGWRAVE